MWYYVVITWDGSDMTVYVNGSPTTSGIEDSFCGDYTGSLVFGQKQESVGGGFTASSNAKMALDTVAIYSTDNAGSVSTDASTNSVDVSAPNLYALWVGGDNTGLDESGNGNDCTVSSYSTLTGVTVGSETNTPTLIPTSIASYSAVTAGSCETNGFETISSTTECASAASSLGYSYYGTRSSSYYYPTGCYTQYSSYYSRYYVYFNYYTSSETCSYYELCICSRSTPSPTPNEYIKISEPKETASFMYGSSVTVEWTSSLSSSEELDVYVCSGFDDDSSAAQSRASASSLLSMSLAAVSAAALAFPTSRSTKFGLLSAATISSGAEVTATMSSPSSIPVPSPTYTPSPTMYGGMGSTCSDHNYYCTRIASSVLNSGSATFSMTAYYTGNAYICMDYEDDDFSVYGKSESFRIEALSPVPTVLTGAPTLTPPTSTPTIPPSASPTTPSPTSEPTIVIPKGSYFDNKTGTIKSCFAGDYKQGIQGTFSEGGKGVQIPYECKPCDCSTKSKHTKECDTRTGDCKCSGTYGTGANNTPCDQEQDMTGMCGKLLICDHKKSHGSSVILSFFLSTSSSSFISI